MFAFRKHVVGAGSFQFGTMFLFAISDAIAWNPCDLVATSFYSQCVDLREYLDVDSAQNVKVH